MTKIILFLIITLGQITLSAQETSLMANSCSISVRCVGSAYCSACTNCSRCGHCSAGGSCGVCSNHYKKPKKRNKSTNQNVTNSNTRKYSLPNDPSSKYYLKNLNINTEILNLRTGPGTSYPILEILKKNQLIIFLAMKGNWIKVKVVSTKTTGFVYYKYIHLSN